MLAWGGGGGGGMGVGCGEISARMTARSALEIAEELCVCVCVRAGGPAGERVSGRVSERVGRCVYLQKHEAMRQRRSADDDFRCREREENRERMRQRRIKLHAAATAATTAIAAITVLKDGDSRREQRCKCRLCHAAESGGRDGGRDGGRGRVKGGHARPGLRGRPRSNFGCPSGAAVAARGGGSETGVAGLAARWSGAISAVASCAGCSAPGPPPAPRKGQAQATRAADAARLSTAAEAKRGGGCSEEVEELRLVAQRGAASPAGGGQPGQVTSRHRQAHRRTRRPPTMTSGLLYPGHHRPLLARATDRPGEQDRGSPDPGAWGGAA